MVKGRFTKTNPFGLDPARVKLHKPGDRKYLLEIGEGTKFLAAAKERLGRNFDFKKLVSVRFLLVLFFFLLFGRAAWLQLAKGSYYRQLADGNRIRIKQVEPRRGVIYDRNRQPLVRNVANFVLYFIPADLPKDESERQVIFDRLKAILPELDLAALQQSLAEIKSGSYEDYQPLFAMDNIDYQKAMLVYLESSTYPGVVLDAKSRREYELPAQSLSHLLGYTGKINADELKKYGQRYTLLDYIGKAGLENSWEAELKGQPGKKQVEVDALGKEKRVISQDKVVDGSNLLLSLDLPSQIKLEKILDEELKMGGFSRGAAIVSNPQNGEIIALVNLPAFDNNVFARGIKKDEYQALLNDENRPLFNRSVAGEYPSGSVIKPVGVAAALDTGTVSESQQFLSSGGLRLNKWFFPDWKAGGHGMTDARKAIAESVNTYMYIIGGGYQDFQGLGMEKLTEYYARFGLGKPTGIDLPGEADGFIPSKEWKEKTKGERWYIGDTYHIAIGQGDLLATPLQINFYTNYLANGRAFYRPHLVKALLDKDGQPVRTIEPEQLRGSVVSDQALRVVREGMRQAVTDGSARRLSLLPVSAAGKTGTAQFNSNKSPHAWFTGFAPYEQPEVALTVLIEEGQEGSRTATAVADKFLRWYFVDRLNPVEAVNSVSGTATTSASSSQNF